MLKIVKIENNHDVRCGSCGKVRKKYYEIRYGFRVSYDNLQRYEAMPLCRACIRKLYEGLEKKCSLNGYSAPEGEKKTDAHSEGDDEQPGQISGILSESEGW